MATPRSPLATSPLNPPQRPKSPPLAFEKTSNDALMAVPIPYRQSVSSASSLPSKNTSITSPSAEAAAAAAAFNSGAVKPMPTQMPMHISMPYTNGMNGFNGNGMSGFSSVRSGTRSPLHSPTLPLPTYDAPEETWKSYCSLQRQAFEIERASWAVERGLLEQEIATLRQEALIAQTKLKQAELAMSDPRGFNRTITATSRSDTRSPSRISSPASNTASLNGSSKSSSPPRCSGAAGIARLPSIRENSNTPGRSQSPAVRQPGPGPAMFASLDGAVTNGVAQLPRFTFPTIEDGPSPLSSLTPGTLYLQEAPYSPCPSTLAPMSPPPPEYVKHAGHTPRPSEFPAGNGHDTPSRVNTKHNESIPHDQAFDEDPPLKGPLFLPTKPDEGNSMLSALDSRLQEVTEDPGAATPSVLSHILPIDLALANARLSESAAGGKEEGSDGEAKRANSDPVVSLSEPSIDAGPKLRIKRSMNFGAPLGMRWGSAA